MKGTMAVKVIKAFGQYPVGFVMGEVPRNQAQVWIDRGLVRETASKGGAMKSPANRAINPAKQAEVKRKPRGE